MAVVLIDEAQVMNIDDFCFLKDVGNELRLVGVQFVPILMAQDPDFERVRDDLRDAQRLDLLSRFAMTKESFASFSEVDVQEILKSIDSEIYPQGADCSWTRFFFPNSWAAGFRFENEADKVISALKKASGREAKGGLTVPARPFFASLRNVVAQRMGSDGSRNPIPAATWNVEIRRAYTAEAVALSGRLGSRGNDYEVQL